LLPHGTQSWFVVILIIGTFKLNAVAKALNKQTNDSSEKESEED
jgi:hypothetical protein